MTTTPKKKVPKKKGRKVLFTYVRADRRKLDGLIEQMSDAFFLMSAMRMQETYGLSVTFDDATLEYTCTDPQGAVRATANTPTGAILFWESVAIDRALVRDVPDPDPKATPKPFSRSRGGSR